MSSIGTLILERVLEHYFTRKLWDFGVFLEVFRKRTFSVQRKRFPSREIAARNWVPKNFSLAPRSSVSSGSSPSPVALKSSPLAGIVAKREKALLESPAFMFGAFEGA
jgi:hypothetical protein